jgi:hypothetical protein
MEDLLCLKISIIEGKCQKKSKASIGKLSQVAEHGTQTSEKAAVWK